MLDIKAVEEEARKELADEASRKAKGALKTKMKELADAEQVVRNIRTQLDDLRAKIGAGEL